ncbi:MAG TPA: sensor domain-containing diguanylate cyclase [Gemmatimonadales bacterium]|nr:sensor domain-containing diguanylate cyclase [Gemmatimonadales bacterium]
MRDSPKSHLVTENAGPAKLQGRTAVHLDAPAAERQRRDRALKASEIRYRRLFETAPYGIAVLDAETGIVVDVNPAACKLLGYDPQDIVDRPLWSIPAFKNAAATKGQFREVILEPHVRYEDLPLEMSDGGIKHVELVSTLFLADSKPFVQCVIHDITDQVKQADEDGQRQEQEHLAATLSSQQAAADATYDEATGLVNRWYLEETLPRELHRAARANAPLTLSVLAPDEAQAGQSDAMLREIGRVIREHLRKSDMAARYGEREFVLVLPNSSTQATLNRVDKIRTAVRDLELLHGTERLRGPVVSAGVANARAHLATSRALLNAATEALSNARRSGGDRVVSYQDKEKTES